MKHVVDANVFIHGRAPNFGEMVTVPQVMDELKSISGERSFAVTDIEVREPTNHAFERVRDISQDINSPTSEVDELLLALTTDVGGKLVTDDKALQNLALHLEVPFQGFIEDEITDKRSWKFVCPSCGREIEKRCSSCGKEAIRRLA